MHLPGTARWPSACCKAGQLPDSPPSWVIGVFPCPRRGQRAPSPASWGRAGIYLLLLRTVDGCVQVSGLGGNRQGSRQGLDPKALRQSSCPHSGHCDAFLCMGPSNLRKAGPLPPKTSISAPRPVLGTHPTPSLPVVFPHLLSRE